jgi:hypothetical protein
MPTKVFMVLPPELGAGGIAFITGVFPIWGTVPKVLSSWPDTS